jgi:hypothetical protein
LIQTLISPSNEDVLIAVGVRELTFIGLLGGYVDPGEDMTTLSLGAMVYNDGMYDRVVRRASGHTRWRFHDVGLHANILTDDVLYYYNDALKLGESCQPNSPA